MLFIYSLFRRGEILDVWRGKGTARAALIFMSYAVALGKNKHTFGDRMLPGKTSKVSLFKLDIVGICVKKGRSLHFVGSRKNLRVREEIGT